MILSIIDKLLGGPSFTEISEINRRIFNLPIENVSIREEIFNKHLQNLVWVFWFGKTLHKDN